MTTETTCLSSIWKTDEKIQEYYEIHGRREDYKELNPGTVAYYDGMVYVNLSEIKPMIAMPFHPSNVYTIDEVNENLADILHDVEKKALVSMDGAVDYSLQNKIVDGKLYVAQGLIAGCAGGGFENICAAADIMRGRYIGADEFTFSVYPASTPIYMELVKNGAVADLMASGAIVKTAFCGPCFGAGDTPANNAFSIRHSTRNFPNREGSKLQSGQISSVALMDWPAMSALPENLIVKVVSEIHDPVTTTDELIPSGETSSYRSNPLGLAEFALSRKDPAYVGRAKEVQKAQKAIEADTCPRGALKELDAVMDKIHANFEGVERSNLGIGSTIFAVKPGDGSAREQAASCQKVLGGWANIANEYATKRYRSNLINWGMLPFITKEDHEHLSFQNGDYIFVPGVRKAIEEKAEIIKAYVIGDEITELPLTLGDLTDVEREIILKGCLINYYRG